MSYTGMRSHREAGAALGALLLCVVLLALWTQQVYTPYNNRISRKSIFHGNPCDQKRLEEGQQGDLTWSKAAGARTAPQNITRRVAIIGAAGYIGSRLHEYLNISAPGWLVHGYDRDPRGLVARVWPLAALDIPDSILAQYDAVVYLGGYTGRVMCDGNPKMCETENVDDVVAFAERLQSRQLLLFASTSAIAEGSGALPQQEDGPVRQLLLDSYSSSMLKREEALKQLSARNPAAPQLVGTRFGTAVGLSPSQRTDLIHMALVCSAYGSGRLKISSPNTHRAVLAIDDLVVALHKILLQPQLASRFEIFHLTSFNTKVVAVANEVAQQIGARADITSAAPASTPGFSLDSIKFQTRFHFHPKSDQRSVVSDLVKHAPQMCLGRDITHRQQDASVPCVVCGSNDMATVLDLGAQPLANDFFTTKDRAVACERYPLKLMHCRRCHHAQLSHLVDRERLFVNYQYQSGTSSTLAKHFEAIVDKVIQGTGKQQGTVLEIASNDGTQLDKFKARGWQTYGVDPAKNLVKLAAAKGHNAIAAFWGQGRTAGLPPPEKLDAIVAQNVFAHVFKPVEFLNACVEAMGPKTLLYIQTSQCEMFQSGQFDTVYHEHVSFFSAHSFQWAANAAGLSITNIEIVPIHGRSCLVTFQKGAQLPATSLQQYMSAEVDTGMTGDWFYKQFGGRAVALRNWMDGMLAQLAEQGYTIGAYGAAAKGMVLLHYLKSSPASKAYEFDFVVDDAPLKQNTFCPGTTIPVKPTAYLTELKADKPLVLVIFAWNFEEEIVAKIRSTMAGAGVDKVLAIVPFPTQRVIQIHSRVQKAVTELLTNPAVPIQWPGVVASIMRCPVVGVSHFYNEEFLMPFFVRHYAPMFDSMLLIDYASTDRSVELLKAEMPASWQVVQSSNKDFGAVAVDAEVRRYERSFPACAWKFTVTTTEMLVHPNLRRMASYLDSNSTVEVIQFPHHIMVGNDSKPFNNDSQLVMQRSQYVVKLDGGYSRFMHRSRALEYSAGRHSVNVPVHPVPSGFILKYSWTPWPQVIPRKLQIKQRIPVSDRAANLGTQHQVDEAALLSLRQKSLGAGAVADLSVYNLEDTDALHNQHVQLWYAAMYGNVTFSWKHST